MGRTSRINKAAGRDHWAQVSSALLTGDMPTGQVIGATDSQGTETVSRPIHYQHVFSTVYHKLGVNPRTTKVLGHRFGRIEPMPLLDKPELVGEVL